VRISWLLLLLRLVQPLLLLCVYECVCQTGRQVGGCGAEEGCIEPVGLLKKDILQQQQDAMDT
jgi:hypothetical protein